MNKTNDTNKSKIISISKIISMKVLKFGGTSVGSSENISKVTKIVINESEKSSIIVVVSAVAGITNKLISASSKAVDKNLDYKNDIKKIKIQHEKIIDNLLNGNSLLETKEIVSEKLSELENLLDGIYLINEISAKTSDKLLSYGELISSLIIFEYCPQKTSVKSTFARFLKYPDEMKEDDLEKLDNVKYRQVRHAFPG